MTTQHRPDGREQEDGMTDLTNPALRALKAHIDHMARGTTHVIDYLEPKADRISKDEFVSRMIEHFDGPEQREVLRLTADLVKEASGESS